MNPFTIENWTATHPRLAELIAFAEQNNTYFGIIDSDELIAESIYFVGVQDGAIAGFIMCLVQPIGPEMDVPAITDEVGEVLTEAKIRGYVVAPACRRQGIGTALQKAVLQKARELGCFQVRSRSSIDKTANYAVKRRLGFACHPDVRQLKDGPDPGVYWVKRVDGE